MPLTVPEFVKKIQYPKGTLKYNYSLRKSHFPRVHKSFIFPIPLFSILQINIS